MLMKLKQRKNKNYLITTTCARTAFEYFKGIVLRLATVVHFVHITNIVLPYAQWNFSNKHTFQALYQTLQTTK